MSAPERIWVEMLLGEICTTPPSSVVASRYARYILATPEALASAPEVVALVEAAVTAERERCIAAMTATCDAEITQAKKLGPMHVPIIIAVKHDCIAAIRAGEGTT